jgi:cathepsin A (carboxypeptidase C)
MMAQPWIHQHLPRPPPWLLSIASIPSHYPFALTMAKYRYTPIGEGARSHRLRKFAAYALGAAALLVSSTLLVRDRQLGSVSTLARLEELSDFPGAADQILALPGLPSSYASRLFSGYLPIGNGGEVFYFFAESQSETKPEADPVMLWLNGGPGASSLAGCFSENGPLLVNADGETLRDNGEAWNKNANLVCIESPVGVGFSYNVSGIYESDDQQQADELYAALQAFFAKFPWLRANDFIIAGESYGGVYVPTTAKRIVEGNRGANSSATIKLTKFVVGNGVNEFNGLSMVLYAYYHGLISTDDYRNVRKSCPDLNEFVPSSLNPSSVPPACWIAASDAMATFLGTNINIYNTYGECHGTSAEGLRAFEKDLASPEKGLPHPFGSFSAPCVDTRHLLKYFNQPSVREAMHTKREIDRWYDSVLLKSNVDNLGLNDTVVAQLKNHTVLSYNSTLGSAVTPLWSFLLTHNVSGVIYHGDADMVCNCIGGLWAVESLQLPRKQKRSIWTVPGTGEGDDQTAGILEDFGKLKYVTVKGGGHLVPQDKPVEAKRMLDLFVLN